jgi:hypothetical protein
MTKTTARAIDPAKRESFKTGNPAIDAVRVIENENKVEDQPRVVKKANEKVVENRHNSSIVLGRDYKYDDLNDTDIGMIDIAVGRVANATSTGEPLLGGEAENEKFSKGDFDLDAARIYLSQKTDVDKDFDLPFGTLGDADHRSAIAVKADAVRLISRDSASGIKLVVEGNNNSRGGDGDGLGGVELIGANGTNMQPIPKSKDLAETLDELAGFVATLENMVVTSLQIQMAFNRKVATEMDISPFYAAPTLPDFGNLPQLGKTSADYFSYITWTGKKLIADIEAFKKLNLGIHRDEESGTVTQIKNPKFASKYHKLD